MTTIIGLIEKVKINGKEVLAKIDTGASRCSLDRSLAEELKLHQVVKKIRIKSSHGKSIRSIVEGRLKIKNRRFKVRFNVADRSYLKYPVLIGVSILKRGFFIDPSK